MPSYQKVKSVSKVMVVKGPRLTKVVLDTMQLISDMVGATLGPGGQPVLIERQELDLPAMVTKDGVTVFRALGFSDPTAHVIMEGARDASVRTASEAGDGTTTATVLANAIVRKVHEYCARNPKMSAQKVVRKMMTAFRDVIEPGIKALSQTADMSTEDGRRLLMAVAKISANGDTELAEAVLQCFDLVGDDGNVTITEVSGKSGFEVEKIQGYPIPIGYEDSCAKFASKFINDPGNQRVVLQDPIFVVFHGRVTEIQSVVNLMENIGAAWQSERGFRHNVVLVATGFSETVLAQLAMNFAEQTTINVYPLLAPPSPVPGGQLGLLEDICTVTGSKLFDPLNNPLDRAQLSELGDLAQTFEAGRFRSAILAENFENLGEEPVVAGPADEDPAWLTWFNRKSKGERAAMNLDDQVGKLHSQMKQTASILDTEFFQERIGKLTGGIAKLKVVGASNGELRERRDRAEDAICAVRGAIRHGCVPGGCWTLMKMADLLMKVYPGDPVIAEVLAVALVNPVKVLLTNCGLTDDEQKIIVDQVLVPIAAEKPVVAGHRDDDSAIWDWDGVLVYDAMEQKIVDPWKAGILDSTPAVLEAVRNSVSIAALLGTLGATAVFPRDPELERSEARATASFLRDGESTNPADERP